VPGTRDGHERGVGQGPGGDLALAGVAASKVPAITSVGIELRVTARGARCLGDVPGPAVTVDEGRRSVRRAASEIADRQLAIAMRE
jgi:hypothetical protein